MALIVCAECKKTVSDKAAACPNCGAPVNENLKIRKTRRVGGLWEGIGFIIILTGIFMMFSDTGPGGLMMAGGFVVFIIGRCL